MNTIDVFIHIVSIALILAICYFYYHGRRHSHSLRLTGNFAHRPFYFASGLLLLIIALFPPITSLAESYLFVRSGQKVLLSMVIPPLLWLSLPLHTCIVGAPPRIKSYWVRNVIRKSSGRKITRWVTRPSFIWLAYTAIFLIWHEPTFASWLIEHYWVNNLFSWLLLAIAMLFWSQVITTAPRVHRPQPGWVLFLMLIAVEIPNMVTGLTVAFAAQPFYPHYESLPRTTLVSGNLLSILADQQLSGCITWIVGSVVYVNAIILVLSRLFQQEKGLPPILSFASSADERTIAPGLEYRVYQNRWKQSDTKLNTK